MDVDFFWLADRAGAPSQLFASVMRREDDRYVLVTPVEKIGIKVDDAPFLAVEMRREDEADGPRLTSAPMSRIW